MNCYRCRGRPDARSGTVLLSIIVVAATCVVLAGALLAIVTKTTLAERDSESSTQLEYVTLTALNEAYGEIASEDDSTGNGLGAIGIETPVDFFDSRGNKTGEWRTIVEEEDTHYVILAVAATPSFQDARFTRTTQGVVQATPDIFLRPLPAAVGISGLAPSPDWTNTGGSTVSIDGGDDHAAFMAADPDTFAALIASLANRIDNGSMSADALSGGVTTEHEFDDGTTLEIPVAIDPNDFVSSQLLNDYRISLRNAVAGLEAHAVRTVSTDLGSTPVVWGTADSPEVTIVDAQNNKNMFDGATVTGAGVLVIHHTVLPSNLTLDWIGDVFVLGHADTINGGDDLFYPRGDSDITINGSFVMLADGDTEASFESKDSAQVTVNGVFLSLAEATSHEAEIETEGSSTLNVNGVVALFGSRVELEASGSASSYNITGSLSIGIADDNHRSDEFLFDMRGNVDIRWDDDNVATGIASMIQLESNLGIRENAQLASYAFEMLGGGSGDQSGDDAVAHVDSLIAQNGTSYDYGVSIDQLVAKARASGQQGESTPWWQSAADDGGGDDLGGAGGDDDGQSGGNDNNRTGLGDGTNPGQGDGIDNSPNEGTDNPNNAGDGDDGDDGDDDGRGGDRDGGRGGGGRGGRGR